MPCQGLDDRQAIPCELQNRTQGSVLFYGFDTPFIKESP